MGCLRGRRRFRKANPIWIGVHQKWSVLTRTVANHYETLALNGDCLCSFGTWIWGTQLMLGMLKWSSSNGKRCANLSFAKTVFYQPIPERAVHFMQCLFFLKKNMSDGTWMEKYRFDFINLDKMKSYSTIFLFSQDELTCIFLNTCFWLCKRV